MSFSSDFHDFIDAVQFKTIEARDKAHVLVDELLSQIGVSSTVVHPIGSPVTATSSNATIAAEQAASTIAAAAGHLVAVDLANAEIAARDAAKADLLQAAGVTPAAGTSVSEQIDAAAGPVEKAEFPGQTVTAVYDPAGNVVGHFDAATGTYTPV
jgi:YD repeat-containing protein